MNEARALLVEQRDFAQEDLRLLQQELAAIESEAGEVKDEIFDKVRLIHALNIAIGTGDASE